MNDTLKAALRFAGVTLDTIKATAIRRYDSKRDHVCSECGDLIISAVPPARTYYMKATVQTMAYRSSADIGSTTSEVRFCHKCCPITND